MEIGEIGCFARISLEQNRTREFQTARFAMKEGSDRLLANHDYDVKSSEPRP